MDQPLSYNAALVLQCIARGHGYGFEMMRMTGLPSGTVYPLLRRLEHAALVSSGWEDVDPVVEGRPQRRIYVATAEGKKALATALERLAEHRRLFDGPVPGPASHA